MGKMAIRVVFTVLLSLTLLSMLAAATTTPARATTVAGQVSAFVEAVADPWGTPVSVSDGPYVGAPPQKAGPVTAKDAPVGVATAKINVDVDGSGTVVSTGVLTASGQAYAKSVADPVSALVKIEYQYIYVGAPIGSSEGQAKAKIELIHRLDTTPATLYVEEIKSLSGGGGKSKGHTNVGTFLVEGRSELTFRVETLGGGCAAQITLPASVGGVAFAPDRFALLAPYIGLTSTIIAATVATAIYVNRVKRRKEK